MLIGHGVIVLEHILVSIVSISCILIQARKTHMHILTDSSETPPVSVPDFLQILQFLSPQTSFILSVVT